MMYLRGEFRQESILEAVRRFIFGTEMLKYDTDDMLDDLYKVAWGEEMKSNEMYLSETGRDEETENSARAIMTATKWKRPSRKWNETKMTTALAEVGNAGGIEFRDEKMK